MDERLVQGLVGVLEARVFADHGDGHFAFGVRDASRRSRRQRSGRAAAHRRCRRPRALRGRAPRRGRRAAPRRCVATSSAWITASGRTLQNSAILRRSSRGSGRSERQSSMSGWMPMRAQLLHRVLGRLGLQLARARDEGHERQMDEQRSSPRGSSLPSWRIASKKGRPSISPTVPPISHEHEIDALIAGGDEALDRVGDVRDDLDRGAEIIAAPLLGDDLLIDAARW